MCWSSRSLTATSGVVAAVMAAISMQAPFTLAVPTVRHCGDGSVT